MNSVICGRKSDREMTARVMPATSSQMARWERDLGLAAPRRAGGGLPRLIINSYHKEGQVDKNILPGLRPGRCPRPYKDVAQMEKGEGPIITKKK